MSNAPGVFAFVDDECYEGLSKHKWRLSTLGYAIRNEGAYKTFWMHREVMDCPDGMVVDHVDGRKLWNIKSNLRICTQTENKRNTGKRSTNTSGYKGVTWSRRAGKWMAQISVNGNRFYLGCFDNPITAAKVYKVAEVWFFGEFAPISETPGELEECVRLWVETERDIRRLSKTSVYRGVIWDKKAKRWAAHIGENGRLKFLGQYKHVVLAAWAYNDAAKSVFGDHARLNTIEERDLEDYEIWRSSGGDNHLRSNNTSGYSGVSLYKASGKWIAQVGFQGQRIALGHYESKEEAAYVVDQVRMQLLPNDIRFNVIDKEGITI